MHQKDVHGTSVSDACKSGLGQHLAKQAMPLCMALFSFSARSVDTGWLHQGVTLRTSSRDTVTLEALGHVVDKLRLHEGIV